MIVEVGYDHADARSLGEQAQTYYTTIYGGRDETPVDVCEFEAPRGAFYVGYEAHRPVAAGGWRFIASPSGHASTRPAEIKRMFVAEDARGLGHARTMLAHLAATAAGAGADWLVLETGAPQFEAIGLYTSSGFTPVPAFGHYRNAPESRHLGKRLTLNR